MDVILEDPDETHEIVTDRMRLRPFTEKELMAAADEIHLPQFARGFPSPEDQDWAREAMLAGSHFHTESVYSVMAVVDQASEQIVGAAGFMGPAINSELEIVGSLIEPYRHLGLAAEVLPALVRLAFRDPQIAAVHASVPEENQPAIAVLERFGFVTREADGTEISYVYPRP